MYNNTANGHHLKEECSANTVSATDSKHYQSQLNQLI